MTYLIYGPYSIYYGGSSKKQADKIMAGLYIEKPNAKWYTGYNNEYKEGECIRYGAEHVNFIKRVQILSQAKVGYCIENVYNEKFGLDSIYPSIQEAKLVLNSLYQKITELQIKEPWHVREIKKISDTDTCFEVLYDHGDSYFTREYNIRPVIMDSNINTVKAQQIINDLHF